MSDNSNTTQSRVRITYEADSITSDAGTDFRVAYTAAGVVLVPAAATIESLEDLRCGDVYRDASGATGLCVSNGWLYTVRPDGVTEWRRQDAAPRPLTLLVRDGQPVLP